MSQHEKIERTNTDNSFWNKQWQDMTIGFHMSSLHPMLSKHINLLLENREKVRFFFPLCGKELDMKWLASLGHQVIGVELNQSALEQFFAENDIKYSVIEKKDFKVFVSADNSIKLYCGDIFKFTNEYEEAFDCIWDRGSLVALPEEYRDQYASHILTLLKSNFRYLLDTFTYDRALYPGPPHSVDLTEVQRLYASKCKIDYVDTDTYRSFNDNLKDSPPKEIVYLLKPLN